MSKRADLEYLIEQMADLLEDCKGVIFANDLVADGFESKIDAVLEQAYSLEDEGQEG